MFSIFKKKYPSSPINLSQVKADMHAHLLPGIDDGVPDITTSLTLIKGLEDLGYTHFISTPHVMFDVYNNTPDTINQSLQKVQKALTETKTHTTIQAAAEYFIDDHVRQLVQQKIPLLTIHQNSILVEFSFAYEPLHLKEDLFNLQIAGYQIIIAHPERYQYLMGNKQMFETLKDMGCYFQINLLSLTGYYGEIPQQLAYYLLKKNWVNFVGTDIHHQRHLEALRTANNIMPIINDLLNGGQLLNPTLAP
jgi:protein-tyrosine phosphatase